MLTHTAPPHHPSACPAPCVHYTCMRLVEGVGGEGHSPARTAARPAARAACAPAAARLPEEGAATTGAAAAHAGRKARAAHRHGRLILPTRAHCRLVAAAGSHARRPHREHHLELTHGDLGRLYRDGAQKPTLRHHTVLKDDPCKTAWLRGRQQHGTPQEKRHKRRGASAHPGPPGDERIVGEAGGRGCPLDRAPQYRLGPWHGRRACTAGPSRTGPACHQTHIHRCAAAAFASTNHRVAAAAIRTK